MIVLVLVRTWVIWGKHPRITAILGATYIVYCLACFGIVAHAHRTGAAGDEPLI